MTPPAATRIAPFVAHAALFACAGALLLVAGEPLVTDDLWWHLALGRAYAAAGPWLAADPLLHTAEGPPAPAAWLADLFLHGVHELGGFTGLRGLHVALLGLATAGVWSLLRRASGSRLVASAGTAAWVAISAYRLFQLRPHLLTILAVLAGYRLLLEADRAPERWRVALAAALFAVWANLHAGFVLGPILLAAGLCGIAVALPFRAGAQRAAAAGPARGLAVALLVCSLATLANPEGVAPHLAYFVAGEATPELVSVRDEWARLDLFALPPENLPPSLTSWLVVWSLVLATPLAGLATLARWRRGEPGGPPAALLGLAGAGLLAMLLAVRFLWLSIFPLLLLASLWRAREPAARSSFAATGAAAAALLVAVGFFRAGDWPMVSHALPSSPGGYRMPYPPPRYYDHAVGFLADAGLEGNLFNEYVQGGYLGYRLAPRLLAYANGTLNFPHEAQLGYAAIRQVRGVADDESFESVLDRMRVDVFLGNRLPREERQNRPSIFTTGHLQGVPGWVLVFRNLDSAVYLRDTPRNEANFARVADYYAGEGVGFERSRGFEPARVVAEAPHWAVHHGLVPVNLDQLLAARFGGDAGRRLSATALLSAIHAVLGACDRALELDAEILSAVPEALPATRRRVWCLLQLDRAVEADLAAEPLRRAPEGDSLSHRIAAAARRNARTPRADVRRQLALRTPLLDAREVVWLTSRVASAAPRPPRRAD